MPKSKIWILSSPPRPRVGTSHRLRASQRYTIMRKLIGKPETYYKWHYCYLKRAVYHSNFQAYNNTVLTNVLCWFWLDADKRENKWYFEKTNSFSRIDLISNVDWLINLVLMWTRFCKNNHICCLQSNTKVFSLIAFNIETFLVLTNFSHKPKLLQITFYYQENLTVITGSLYHITIDRWSSLLWYLSTLQRVLNYSYFISRNTRQWNLLAC